MNAYPNITPSQSAPLVADVSPEDRPLSAAMVVLSYAANSLGIRFNPAALASSHRVLGLDLKDDMLAAASDLGLIIKRGKLNLEKLKELRNPMLVTARIGGVPAAVVRVDTTHVVLAQAGVAPTRITHQEFLNTYEPQVLLVRKRDSAPDEVKAFGFAWVVSVMLRYRSTLRVVFIAQLVVQILSLATPLFTQVVIDKAVMHQNLSTMTVLGVGMIILIAFETALSVLEKGLSAHTANRVDAVMGGALVRHLLRLPMGYFDSRKVGDSVARIRELETVRNFISGNALQTAIDSIFLVLVVSVMMFISPVMTLVVICSIPFYLLLALLTRPTIRQRLNDKYNLGAENQSFLVETITGIQTVKTLGLEATSTKRWDQQLATYLSATFKVATISYKTAAASQAIQRLTLLAVLWIGAIQVMNNALTIGQLIAFQMLAMRMVSPMVKILELWHDFQQIGISVRRIGDIFTVKPEPSSVVMSHDSRRIQGRIEFNDVSFRYNNAQEPVLNKVSFSIAPGELVAVVGRSGSGKSTIAKLVQKLYNADAGMVSIDSLDINMWDLQTMRLQMGAVPQESFLFSGTIFDNISARMPEGPAVRIERAAKIADAHEFIGRLPQGYATEVSEQGRSLSGGQRQRVALARALFLSPKILILDEATAALDHESEVRILNNLKHPANRTTTLMVTHRKAAMAIADRVVYLESGAVVAQGSFAELYARFGNFKAMVDEGGTA